MNTNKYTSTLAFSELYEMQEAPDSSHANGIRMIKSMNSLDYLILTIQNWTFLFISDYKQPIQDFSSVT